MLGYDGRATRLDLVARQTRRMEALAREVLARAVIGGLACSTLVTLLLVPAAYRLMHRKRA